MIAGTAMVVIAIVALTSGGDGDSPTSERTAPERAITEGSQPPQAGGTPGTGTTGGGGGGAASPSNATGTRIHEDLAQRRPVRAPDFSLPVVHEGSVPGALDDEFGRATEGDTLKLSALRGTPVVLHVWSSKCTSCRSDSRLLEATWKRWGPRGVLFAGLHARDPVESAKSVVRQYDLTFPAVLDRPGRVAKEYGVTALPQTFFISGGGEIVGEVMGSPSVRQLEVGSAAAKSGEPFGSEQGSSRQPLR